MKKNDFFAGTMAIAALLMFMAPKWANAGNRPFPEQIDPARHYVFYMHGTYGDRHGSDGYYKFFQILDALEEKGLVPIGEEREGADIMDYAETVTGQARRLLDAGVPPENILVAGHSRGGKIALRVATLLEQSKVRYGLFATCGYKEGHTSIKKYRRFLKSRAHLTQGDFLVMWDTKEEYAKDCDAAMKKAAQATYKNIELPTSVGHTLFYSPDPVWIDPMVAFAKGN